ncbi:MAG: hypothetical protein QW292_04455 [Candidatus Parvarchaeota archaeon]
MNFKKGVLFSIPGVIGAELGLLTPGNKLLFIFAILIGTIACLVLFPVSLRDML